MDTEKLFHVGIKALIENRDGNILLLKVEGNRYNKNVKHWDIPGGRIQQGSNVTETLKREVEEEIGVKEVTDSEFFSAVVSNHEFAIESGHHVGLILMIYKVKIPQDSKITLSDEHTGFEWVDRKEAGKRLANKYPPEFTDLL